MSVTTLSYNKRFADFLAAALRANGVKDTTLFDSFNRFVSHVEHNDSPELVIIDAHYIRDGHDDVWRYLERKNVPCLMVDDLLGHLTEQIEEGRYPSNTIGVISNEVLAQPHVLKEVIGLVQDQIGKPAHAVQRQIHDVLVRYCDLWGMDPDYPNQYGKLAQG